MGPLAIRGDGGQDDQRQKYFNLDGAQGKIVGREHAGVGEIKST